MYNDVFRSTVGNDNIINTIIKIFDNTNAFKFVNGINITKAENISYIINNTFVKRKNVYPAKNRFFFHLWYNDLGKKNHQYKIWQNFFLRFNWIPSAMNSFLNIKYQISNAHTVISFCMFYIFIFRISIQFFVYFYSYVAAFSTFWLFGTN